MAISIIPYCGTMWQGNTVPMCWSIFQSKHDNLSEYFHLEAIQVNGAYNWPSTPDL